MSAVAAAGARPRERDGYVLSLGVPACLVERNHSMFDIQSLAGPGAPAAASARVVVADAT